MNYFIHSSAVVDEGARVGEGTRVWHFSHIMSKAFIGSRCIVGQNVFIGDHVRIGNGVKIQNNVSVYEGVHAEDDVFIGPSVVFTNVKNPRSFIDRKHAFRITLIKKGASIGANATIVCGVTLGRFCLIGAGAVVTKDAADHALITGIPGRQTGWVSEAGEVLIFDVSGHACCTSTGEKYFLDKGRVFKSLTVQ